MPAGKGFLIGAVQMASGPLPPEANPCSRRFDPEAMDAHVRARTDKALRLFGRAGEMGLDLVLGGEDMQGVGWLIAPPGRLDLLRRFSQTIPGPLCDEIAAVARRYGMHVAACFFERAGSRYYNTAVLFDGRGRIVGKYRKVHLPPQEACVLTPGRRFNVIDTPLGRVGFMICYDIMFPESARCLALEGADMLLHPTAGYGWTESIGDLQVRSRAADNDVHLIVACPRRSQVIDPWGDVLADAGNRRDVIIAARIAPRGHKTFRAGHFHRALTGIKRIRDELVRERFPGAYRVLTAPAPAVLSAAGAPRRIHTRTRKAFIRKALAEELKAAAQGRKTRRHWTAR